jgi:hypothetical protein
MILRHNGSTLMRYRNKLAPKAGVRGLVVSFEVLPCLVLVVSLSSIRNSSYFFLELLEKV